VADEVQDDIPKSPWLGHQCVINHWSGFAGKRGFGISIQSLASN